MVLRAEHGLPGPLRRKGVGVGAGGHQVERGRASTADRFASKDGWLLGTQMRTPRALSPQGLAHKVERFLCQRGSGHYAIVAMALIDEINCNRASESVSSSAGVSTEAPGASDRTPDCRIEPTAINEKTKGKLFPNR
jgi:hypothetical protein